MPESASFSVRKKPNYRRRRTFVVIGLLVAVVIVLLVLPRGGNGRPKGQATPRVTFAKTINVVSQSKAPDAPTRQANAGAVVQMVTDFYQAAFIDPKKWGDGTFPDLKALFSDEAQASFTKDIASLTIGAARTQLKFVDPGVSTLGVTVYFDKAAAPTFAVAAVSFNARGTLKQTGPPLIIKQKASFYMQKSGDKWLITAYDAEQTQETPTPSPSPSAS